MIIEKITTSAPGRICLFGEHQDYLGLPVITAAINLRISISAQRRDDRKFCFRLPDIDHYDEFEFDQSDVRYVEERDYLRSAFNIVRRKGITIPYGYDCEIHGNIPINSGTSSSSALIVAYIQMLLSIGNDPVQGDPMEIARLAHLAEVVEFDEPGGMMDHYATALGGVLYITFDDGTSVKQLPITFGKFVLGDSREPKDTKSILSRVKGGIQDSLSLLQSEGVNISLHNNELDDLHGLDKMISPDKQKLLRATFNVRDITRKAMNQILAPNPDLREIARLMTSTHEALRDGLNISTHKIDLMLRKATKAGAWGGKINGSGGGGCMFVYAPERTEEVAKAICESGGLAHIVYVDDGVRVDNKSS